MFWGDIIIQHPELIGEVPKDTVCLNWNYTAKPDEFNAKYFADNGFMQYMCPGVSGWSTVMNHMDNASNNILNMVNIGKKYGAICILNTDWGDFGHLNFLSNSMPGMIFGASLSWNPENCTSEGEYENFDIATSVLEYGEQCNQVVSILRELSRQQTLTWWYLMCWADSKFDGHCWLDDIDKKIHGTTEKEIWDAYNKAMQLTAKLLKLRQKTTETCRTDFEEFYISANGIMIIQALHLILKKYEYNEHIQEFILLPDELAVKLEYWLTDFSKLWRNRNKESELYRIKDKIMQLCNYLRRLKKQG